MKTKTLKSNLKYLSAIIAAALFCLASIPLVRAEIPAVDFKAKIFVSQVVQGGVIGKVIPWQYFPARLNVVGQPIAARIGYGSSLEEELVYIAGDFPTAVDGTKLEDIGLRANGRYQYNSVGAGVKTIKSFTVVPLSTIPEIKEPIKPLGAGSLLNTPQNSKPLGGGSALDAPKKRNR